MEFSCRACYRIVDITCIVPPVCPQCGEPQPWKAVPDFDTPTRPYHLSVEDCRFLRVNKIDPEA